MSENKAFGMNTYLPQLSQAPGEYTREFGKFLQNIRSVLSQLDIGCFYDLFATDENFETFEKKFNPFWDNIKDAVHEVGDVSKGIDVDLNIERLKENPSNLFGGIRIQIYYIQESPGDELGATLKNSMTVKEAELIFVYTSESEFKLLPVYKPFVTLETI